MGIIREQGGKVSRGSSVVDSCSGRWPAGDERVCRKSSILQHYCAGNSTIRWARLQRESYEQHGSEGVGDMFVLVLTGPVRPRCRGQAQR